MFAWAFLVAAAATVGVPEMHYGVGWSRATAPPSMGVSFEIYVWQQNLAELRRRALEVSTPSSPSYGHFLKQAEIAALTAPAVADVAAVTGWLAQHPAVACSADRERLLCRDIYHSFPALIINYSVFIKLARLRQRQGIS